MTHSELGTERIRTLLFKYALPAIIAMTASSIYNIVDSIYIGHGVGALALSGLTIAKPLMDICAAFGSLVGVGAGTLIAIKLGEKDILSSNKILGNVIMLNLLLGVLVMVAGLLFLDPILCAFGASADTLPFAHDYMAIILYGNVTTHIYFGLNNMLRSTGHPMKSMTATILAVVINMVLDPIFIFGLDMGVRGAALATVLSQCIAIVWQVTVFFNTKEPIHFQKGIWSLDRSLTLRMLSIGLSPFLMNLASCFVMVILNNQLKRYGGDLAIASFGVVNRLVFVFFMIVMGLNQGMQPIASYNYGARQMDRVKRVFQLTAYAASIITTVVTLLGEICPQLVVQLFTHDEELIEASSYALRIIVCAFFVVGFQAVVTNLFTALGMAKKAIFLSLSRQVLILVPLCMLLPLIPAGDGVWGLDGVWWAWPIADACASMLAAVLLMRQMRAFQQMHLSQQQLLAANERFLSDDFPQDESAR